MWELGWTERCRAWERGGTVRCRAEEQGVPADLHSTSGGDHKLRRTLYNMMTKAAPVRVGRHRNKVQDHSFTDEYLPGRARPGDYTARHAKPSEGLYKEEEERLKGDTGEDTWEEQVLKDELL